MLLLFIDFTSRKGIEMNTVNKVILIGYVGSDPEIIYTPSGHSLANISLATNNNFKRNGVWESEAEWHKLTAWNLLAEKANKMIQKGTHLYVEGKLKTTSWTDKKGNKKVNTIVSVKKFIVLGNGKKQEVSPEEQMKDFFDIKDDKIPELNDDIPF